MNERCAAKAAPSPGPASPPPSRRGDSFRDGHLAASRGPGWVRGYSLLPDTIPCTLLLFYFLPFIITISSLVHPWRLKEMVTKD